MAVQCHCANCYIASSFYKGDSLATQYYYLLHPQKYKLSRVNSRAAVYPIVRWACRRTQPVRIAQRVALDVSLQLKRG